MNVIVAFPLARIREFERRVGRLERARAALSGHRRYNKAPENAQRAPSLESALASYADSGGFSYRPRPSSHGAHRADSPT